MTTIKFFTMPSYKGYKVGFEIIADGKPDGFKFSKEDKEGLINSIQYGFDVINECIKRIPKDREKKKIAKDYAKKVEKEKESV